MEQNINLQAADAAKELIETAKLADGEILVVGCSSSEIVGENIGHGSSLESAEAVFDGIMSAVRDRGIFIAAQCCEHLNRALVVERECAERYGLTEVCVMPAPKAGGSFATTAYKNFKCPVVVESISAHAGIDIGNTLIGMHLRAVAVPVRLSVKAIGHAPVVAARTRAKLIGGARAEYPSDIR